MLEEIKLLLGDAADNFTDAQIGLAIKIAMSDVEEYCKRELDYNLELQALKIAVIRLNRMNTEGISAHNYGGVSENFIDGLPADILAVLNRKRKIKVV
jgi:hypothetical protein